MYRKAAGFMTLEGRIAGRSRSVTRPAKYEVGAAPSQNNTAIPTHRKSR
jgi:hypothetical protein